MKFLVFLCLFVYNSTTAKLPDINSVRSLLERAPTEEKACKELLVMLQPFNENNNSLLSGYKASATMIMAKHVFNPFSKLSYFKKGKNIMEKAIAADSANIELRFLRFSVQTNIPSFLGYKENIKNDKNFLLKSLPAIKDLKLKKMIVAFLSTSDYVTDKEKNSL